MNMKKDRGEERKKKKYKKVYKKGGYNRTKNIIRVGR